MQWISNGEVFNQMWKGTPQVMHSVTWITTNSSRHLNCVVHLTAVERSDQHCLLSQHVFMWFVSMSACESHIGCFPKYKNLKHFKLWSHSCESLVLENQSKHFPTLDKGMETLALWFWMHLYYLGIYFRNKGQNHVHQHVNLPLAVILPVLFSYEHYIYNWQTILRLFNM